MTQPAKVQEPSMEEILASIRRIIADDEAKPPVAEKAPSPSPPPAAAKPEKAPAAAPTPKPVMDSVPPSNVAAAKAAAAKATAAPPPKPAPVATNSQDDIDALLSGLDEATTEAEIRPSPSVPEVLELTDEMALPSPPRASFKKVEPRDDLEFAEAAAKPAYRPPAYEPPPFESPTVSQQILSRSTASAVETAFSSLTNTVTSNNGRTLEDLVKEMLRPMLKSWLDDNLPGLVERIVKAEIERVSRGR
jgi:cell pole-organizing protein PopZ